MFDHTIDCRNKITASSWYQKKWGGDVIYRAANELLCCLFYLIWLFHLILCAYSSTHDGAFCCAFRAFHFHFFLVVWHFYLVQANIDILGERVVCKNMKASRLFFTNKHHRCNKIKKIFSTVSFSSISRFIKLHKWNKLSSFALDDS